MTAYLFTIEEIYLWFRVSKRNNFWIWWKNILRYSDCFENVWSWWWKSEPLKSSLNPQFKWGTKYWFCKLWPRHTWKTKVRIWGTWRGIDYSADLTTKNSWDFRKFRKPAAKIKILMFQWNQKIKVPEESGFLQKETISTNIQRQKLHDLDFLRN